MADTALTQLSPSYLRSYVPAVTLSTVAMIACATAAGVSSLGFFLGGVAMAALIAPVIVAVQDRLVDRLLAAGGAADGVAIVALAAIFAGSCSWGQWLQFYLLLVAWAGVLMALTGLLIELRVNRWVAAGLSMLAAMAWMLWPVWLSPWLTKDLANWLTPCHPLFATNAVMRPLGLWSEQAGVVYHLTALNQDIPHRLPESAWPAMAAHLLAAAMLLLLAQLLGRDRSQTSAPI